VKARSKLRSHHANAQQIHERLLITKMEPWPDSRSNFRKDIVYFFKLIYLLLLFNPFSESQEAHPDPGVASWKSIIMRILSP